MLNTPEPAPLARARMTGAAHEGLHVTTIDGRPARLAIIDDDGNILEAGDQVAAAAWRTTACVLRNFLRGLGHLRLRTTVTGDKGNREVSGDE